ncbi:hypothetical protein Trydic_g9179 [Trypoxylus dichotomus]
MRIKPVSSAYIAISLFGKIDRSKMYMLNKVGPGTDSCRTPAQRLMLLCVFFQIVYIVQNCEAVGKANSAVPC